MKLNEIPQVMALEYKFSYETGKSKFNFFKKINFKFKIQETLT